MLRGPGAACGLRPIRGDRSSLSPQMYLLTPDSSRWEGGRGSRPQATGVTPERRPRQVLDAAPSSESRGAGCSGAPQRPPLSRRLREEPGGQAQTAGWPCRGTEPRRGWGRRVGGGRAGPAAGGSVTWASPLASASPPACSDRQTRWSLRALHRLWCWTGQGHEGGPGAGEATCCPGRTVNIGGQKPVATRGLPGPS